jgi:manganese/iron transport system permease protein/iron/zinc/copper transport system permease protein
MMVLAGFFGVSSVVGGLYLAVAIDSAGGGAIVLFSTMQFLLALMFAPRYGMLADWLRRRRVVPQEHQEDILKQLYHGPSEGMARGALKRLIGAAAGDVVRAVERLTAEGLTDRPTGGKLRLTEMGRERAEQVVRAHRIWETYLEQTGVPAEDVHDKAERLEHLDDHASVEYLDHRLGHPLTDPHGSEIPRPRHMFVSTMAPGSHATIAALSSGVHGETGLNKGDRIQLTSRASDATEFTVTRTDGHAVPLSHEQADEIRVKNDAPAANED